MTLIVSALRHSDHTCRCICMLSLFTRVLLFAILWTGACQGPLSIGFSRQEYWSGLPHTPSEDLPDPGTEPESLMSPELAGRFFTTSTTYVLSLSPKPDQLMPDHIDVLISRLAAFRNVREKFLWSSHTVYGTLL